MPDYIPSKDLDRITWLLYFDRCLTDNGGANALAYGITWAKAFECCTHAGQTATAITELKEKEAIGRAVAPARNYAQKLQYDTTMTDAACADAVIIVPDTDQIIASADAVAAREPPLLPLDFHPRHREIRVQATVCQSPFSRKHISTAPVTWTRNSATATSAIPWHAP